MKYIFNATLVSVSNSDGATVIAFADDRDSPDKYVILQRADTFDEQDMELGQDTYHIEVGRSDCVGYGGLSSVALRRSGVILKAVNSCPHLLDVTSMEISFSIDDALYIELCISMRKIISGTDALLEIQE